MKKKNRLLCLLALVVCVVIALCACAPTGSPDEGIFESILDLSGDTSEPISEGVLADGEYLTVLDVISITPRNVAVFGTLKDAARKAGVTTVRITGPSGLDVSEECDGDYFIIPVTLPGQNKATLSAMVMQGEDALGEPLSFSAPYDSTAETRLDGNSVSVGVASRLYFTKYLDNYLSKELYTASQLKSIRAAVASTQHAYTERAKGNEVALVYVFLPDMLTMDSSILREEDVAAKNDALATRYEQIVEALGSTRATVIDMRTILQAELDNGKDIYDLYRKTDSHPTEYTSFLMYQEVMKQIAAIDADVVPHTLDDFNLTEIEALGGNYTTYGNFDREVIREKITLLQPKFSRQEVISGIRVYTDVANKDYTQFNTLDSLDNVKGIAERNLLDTGRTNLPNVLIYRDDNTAAASLMVADDCGQTLLARTGDFYISLTDAGQYRNKEEGKSVTDCIVVFVSESNIGAAFN